VTRAFLASLVWLCALWQSPQILNWVSGGGVNPPGTIIFVDSGTCPTAYTELAHGGNYILLTTAAGGDAGTTGGSNSFTPTVNSLTAAAQTFTGSSTTVPALGFGTIAASQAADTFGTTKFTTSSSGTAAFTSETARGAITVSGSTATGTLTPLGSNAASAVTGTLNQVTVQPTYLKLIACKKN
jgi:hypothetical protein